MVTMQPIRLDLLPYEARQEILADLFHPEPPPAPEPEHTPVDHGPYCECMACWEV